MGGLVFGRFPQVQTSSKTDVSLTILRTVSKIVENLLRVNWSELESIGVNWSELGATAGGRTLVLLTGAAKINDFRSKLEFRGCFRKLGVDFCAQAWRFRHIC